MSTGFSTKRLTVIVAPTPERMGVGRFEFLDDYSVFHFGTMPDQIPGKGEALCRMAVENFRLLAERGIPTHFRAFIPPRAIEFDLLRVLDPRDVQIRPGERTYLVPLEVVFRNCLPPGASVFRRLQNGSLRLDRLGLAAMPRPGDRLDRPLIELTTKLEPIDRFVDEAEARALAGLTDPQVRELHALTVEVDDVITRRAASVGLEHADGKLEFGVTDAGTFTLVDVTGTPDENRFLFQGGHVGKQVLRDYYAHTDLEAQVDRAVAEGRPRSAWPVPAPLPPLLRQAISDQYRAVCERWIGTKVWGGPSLDEATRAVAELMAPVSGSATGLMT